MDELIARLEKATEPNVALDVAIRDSLDSYVIPFVVNPAHWATKIGDDWIRVIRVGLGGSTSDRYVEPYTSSVDAALTLMPENCYWRVGHAGDEHPRQYHASCMPLGPETWGHSSVPAIALCIAALKARNHAG